ncbi:hypothetical protein FB45DRAFT_1002418 [Roridomyces roridus]|uniref:Uncharacterized protein n=1 Tax=Roridomyces roridus TaxID=1738132 RepID=A0AAD7FNW0_9AGAR|nr:hypothetical protein FB45DRAFT_1002418 [Roridomyces roridus]
MPPPAAFVSAVALLCGSPSLPPSPKFSPRAKSGPPTATSLAASAAVWSLSVTFLSPSPSPPQHPPSSTASSSYEGLRRRRGGRHAVGVAGWRRKDAAGVSGDDVIKPSSLNAAGTPSDKPWARNSKSPLACPSACSSAPSAYDSGHSLTGHAYTPSLWAPKYIRDSRNMLCVAV